MNCNGKATEDIFKRMKPALSQSFFAKNTQ